MIDCDLWLNPGRSKRKSSRGSFSVAASISATGKGDGVMQRPNTEKSAAAGTPFLETGAGDEVLLSG